MRKVFLFSAIALAAAVSCTKSEVVDTKFNEAISFESYLGRDAQTKGSVVERADLSAVTVYGYYTGNTDWSTEANVAPNLWEGGLTLELTDDGVKNLADGDKRYWANATDHYTFLSYGPIDNANLAAPTSLTNPTLSYTVDTDFQKHVDVLRATPIINKDKTELNGAVALNFSHTLARVNVKATLNAATPFEYHIKSIKLSGKFNTKGTLSLADADGWNVAEADCKNETYTFYENNSEPTATTATKLAVGETDYSQVVPEGAKYDNYMMMIPTTFSADNKATLEVVYYTYAGGVKSRDYTVKHEITTGFDAGKAYTFKLGFIQNTAEITFSVAVGAWSEQSDVEISGN